MNWSAARHSDHRRLDLAFELRHPAYDCFYLALAELADADFATADTGLARKILTAPGFPGTRLHVVGGNG